MVVTLLGMVTLVKPLQYSNALSPIDVTDFKSMLSSALR